MTDKIHVGLVGTSDWSAFMYLSTLHGHPHAEITAICGQNRERAEERAAKYNISRVFTNHKDMIHQGSLDAVIIATPDDLHYEMSMEALRAGLHVLCEKPLAMTAAQARDMYEEAQRAGVKHMVLFTYRWMPFFRYLRDLIGQGYLGRYYHCEFRYQMGYGREAEYLWRLDQKRANGALGDLGVHMIDLARWLVGDITRVSAQLGVFVERPGADGGVLDPANDSAFLLVEFANGAQGMIHVSIVAHLADREMQQQVKLYGEAGTIEFNITYKEAGAGAVIRAARNEDQQFQILEVPASYWGQTNPLDPFDVFLSQQVGSRAFMDAILKDDPVTPTFYDGYKAQQVIEAAVEGHKSGTWVAIEDTKRAS